MRWWLMTNHPLQTRCGNFVDDTSLSEKIKDGDVSRIQSSVDEIQSWTQSNLAESNEEKCK